jgi:lysozyme
MNLTLLYAELRRDEAVRRWPYKDTSTPPRSTVGVGHNLDALPLPAGWTYPLSDAQITQLLMADVGSTFHQLDAYLPWWRTLSEVRQRVIANMCFNLGIARLLGFKKALSAMQIQDWSTSAAEMKDSTWYGQVKDRAVRLCGAMLTDVMPTA